LGAVSSLTYDIMERVVSQSDALDNVTSFEYDAAGRRVAKTDAEGAGR
jgi:YD repeat-containing protein